MPASAKTAALRPTAAAQPAHFSVLPAAETAVDPVESAIRTVQIEWEALNGLVAALDSTLETPFRKAIATLLEIPGRIIVTGMGKSGHIGRKIDATFCSTGTPSEFVHAAEASHGDLGKIQPGDAVIALSYSGNTRELADIIAHTRRFAIPLIAITGNATSELGLRADVCLTLPAFKEACPNNQAPTTSTTMTLALGDALAIALMEAKGFAREHFRIYHPGGKLGAELIKVSELMQSEANGNLKGGRLPLVSRGSPMIAALHAINAAGLGVAGITGTNGELVGIITDGDIRRANAEDGFAGWNGITVDSLMMANPRVTNPDKLAGEAVKLMQERQINLLIVTEEQNGLPMPVGVLHIQQCMKAGLV